MKAALSLTTFTEVLVLFAAIFNFKSWSDKCAAQFFFYLLKIYDFPMGICQKEGQHIFMFHLLDLSPPSLYQSPPSCLCSTSSRPTSPPLSSCSPPSSS